MTNKLYKEAFLKQMLSKINGSYVMDAVRAARPQNVASAAEEAMTLHGTVLGAFKQQGAVGASTISKAINKGRTFVGNVDTALGAMAIGKKGMQDTASTSFRKNMFTFKHDNLRTVPKAGPSPLKPTFDDPNNLRHYAEQSRPSISAPIHTVARIAVPSLAMMKGQELLEGFKNRNKEVNHAGDFNQGG